MIGLKKALVTGSAVGIGKAIAFYLARQGFDVAFHYNRSQEAAHQACTEAAEFGIKTIALQADVTQPDAAQSLVERAAEELGGLSVVVNNVGNYLVKRIGEISVKEWHSILDSNLNATFYVTQTALPYLKAAGWGRIVNIGFASAQNAIAHPTIAPYAIAKTGIIIYTKSLAKDLVQDNITANVVSPGVAENSHDIDTIIDELPAGRAATLTEIANAVGFFVSPEADYITGQILEVSGAWNL